MADHTERKETQESKIRDELKKVHDLWNALGTPVKPSFEEIGFDITDTRLAAITKEADAAAREVGQRKAAVTELCKEIADQIDELKLEDEADADDKDAAMGARITAAGLVGPDIALSLTRTNFTGLDKQILAKNYEAVGVHSNTIKMLEERMEVLSRMRAERDGKLREMAQKITHLWVRLAVPPEEQQAWIKNHKGLSIKSLRSCQLELIRLLHLKAQSLSTLISHARTKLTELWDELQMGADERAEFREFTTTDVSDAVLEAHESMIKLMEVRAAAMRPLLQLIEKRAALREEAAELKRSEQDPNRYKIPHRLIQETRLRNKLDKQIPKVEQELRQGIPAWEASYGEFRVNGIRFIDIMDEEDAAEAHRRDEEKMQKEREKTLKKAAAHSLNGPTAAPTNTVRLTSGSKVLGERPASAVAARVPGATQTGGVTKAGVATGKATGSLARTTSARRENEIQ